MLKWLASEKLWYDDLVTLALSSLANDFLLDDFDMALQSRLGLPAKAGTSSAKSGVQSAWCIPIDDLEEIAANAASITDEVAQALLAGHSLWWTEGSPHIDPSVLVYRGLPEPVQFAAMLDGSWSQSGWQLPAPLVP